MLQRKTLTRKTRVGRRRRRRLTSLGNNRHSDAHARAVNLSRKRLARCRLADSLTNNNCAIVQRSISKLHPIFLQVPRRPGSSWAVVEARAVRCILCSVLQICVTVTGNCCCNDATILCASYCTIVVLCPLSLVIDSLVTLKFKYD